MNQVTLTATEGPIHVDSDIPLPISSSKSHGSPHTDCLPARTCSKRGTGASGSYTTSLQSLKSTLPIQALILGVLLVISFCMQRPQGPLRKGMQPRRLAGGGKDSESAGDVLGPPSPDFSELCADLGFWSPSNPLPGDPRSSPVLVESFFTSLDQSVRQFPAHTSPPAAASSLRHLLQAKPTAGEKRPVGDEVSDEGAAPGPSWKVARTSAPITAGEGSSSQLMDAASSSDLPSSSQASLISSGAAAGVAPPQAAGGDPHSQHPFVRLPVLDPGVSPRPFLASEMKNPHGRARYFFPAVSRMRELLLKERLQSAEANEMMLCAQVLANHAYHWMRTPVNGVRPSLAVIRLGHRFMVLLSLYRASQALGQNWPSQPWWRELIDRTPHEYFFDVRKDPRASRFDARLANRLSAALQALRNQEALPNTTILTLIRRLFCMENSPFREQRWDPWRQDDAESSGFSRRR